ncbi:MAG: hypothetical protein LIO45_00945 [Clostridiales bacterium]|nr:hypothetical protein [Clostridiales bacterium]
MTDYNTLITRLKELAEHLANYDVCFGCGHEHNCGTEGCAILRDAVATMEQLYKDCWGHCAACVQKERSCNDEPCLSCDFCLRQNWQWQGVQKDGC